MGGHGVGGSGGRGDIRAEMTTGTDPTRLPIAVLVAPVIGMVTTGFIAIIEAGGIPSSQRERSRGETTTEGSHMERGEATGIGIALGAGLGVTAGAIFGNITLGIVLGAGLGVVVGSLISWDMR